MDPWVPLGNRASLGSGESLAWKATVAPWDPMG